MILEILFRSKDGRVTEAGFYIKLDVVDPDTIEFKKMGVCIHLAKFCKILGVQTDDGEKIPLEDVRWYECGQDLYWTKLLESFQSGIPYSAMIEQNGIEYYAEFQVG